MWDLSFDPNSGDLIRDDAGGWEVTTTADTAVLNQLTIHRGAWWGNPAIGSLYFDRDRFASAPAELVAAEARRALAVLVADGLIADVQVIAEESSKAGRVNARTLYRVVETGENVAAVVPVLGG